MIDLLHLNGPVVFAAVTVAMLLVVPVERIRRFALFGGIFGGVLPFLVIGMMQNILGLWQYRGVDPVNLAGIPVFLALTWAPSVVIFAHLLLQYRSLLLRLLLLLSVGAGVTWLQYLHLQNNMLHFNNWNLAETFVLTVFLHTGMIMALHFMGHLYIQDLLKT